MMACPLRLLAAALFLAGTALAAYQPNERQKNTIEHIAQVVAGSARCDDWALNERLVGAISLATGIDINDQETFDYVEGRVLFHADRIKARERQDICAAIERLYGPGGANVDGLAIRATR